MLAFEVTATIIRESIYCAIGDAFVTAGNIEKLVRNRINKGYFEELAVEALSYWSVLGVFARAPALLHASLKGAGEEDAQVRLLLEGVEFMNNRGLRRGQTIPRFPERLPKTLR